MFFAGEVFSLVERAISPAFLSMAVLQVILPLAFIPGAVHMDVDSVSVCLVVHPIALVDIAVDVNELALAVCSVVLPVAFVTGTVGPNLFSEAISEASDPLSIVSSACFEYVSVSLFPLGVWVVNCIRNGFFLFVNSEVATISSLGLPD